MNIHKPPYIIKMKFWGRWHGITIYPFIFVDDIDNRTLIEHEKIHIRQQLNGWLIGFYLKYFYYNLKYGYKNNPYEVEAYAHQDDWKSTDTISNTSNSDSGSSSMFATTKTTKKGD